MRIGVFGGTFDPVHSGHLLCAEKARRTFSLDAVIFVPTGNPPHKIATRVTPGAARVEMLKRAVEDREGLYVWDAEVRRRGYTYTVDTVAELREILTERFGPQAELFYIIGTDVVGTLCRWKDCERVFSMCRFIAVDRPGESGEYRRNVEAARAAGAQIACMEADGLIEVSSSELRKRIAAGKSTEGLLPAAVAAYVEEKRLYREDEPVSEEWIRADLREILTEEKYLHSLGVSEESERLAGLYGGRKDWCRLAGLLHDCAKCLTAAQLAWMGVTLSDFDGGDPYCGINRRVLHGFTGRILAEKRYGITEEEVLLAVQHHVTGAPEMSLTEQIVFLSDYTEKNREGAFFDQIRERLREDGLLPAILLACDMTASLVAKRGEVLDINTVRTRNWAIMELARRKEL